MYAHYYMNRSRPVTQVFVLATPRVGSDLLVSYLDSLPDVSMRGEILHPGMLQGIRPGWLRKRAAAFRHVKMSLYSLATPVVGAKILLDQLPLHDLDPTDLLDITENPKFLILYRRSLAEQYVSLEISRQTNVWTHISEQPPPKRSVAINAERFLSFTQHVRTSYERLIANDRIRQRAIVISYEELTADVQGLFKSVVTPFLSVPGHTVATRYRRVNPQHLSEKVTNFDELEELLLGRTSFQTYTTEGRRGG